VERKSIVFGGIQGNRVKAWTSNETDGERRRTARFSSPVDNYKGASDLEREPRERHAILVREKL